MAEIKEGTKFTEEEMKKVEDFRNYTQQRGAIQ